MEVLKTAILEMCRQKKNQDFCPSEVVKLMFPEDWEQFNEEVNTKAMEMNREGLIVINQNETVLKADSFPPSTFRISGLNINHTKL